MMLVKDLFKLPETVKKNDFVTVMTTSVGTPETTADTFIVTPQLAQCFDRALTLVGTSLADGRSLGAYLHGSFGSGKSHFMAVLSLLLRGDEHAWRKPELHDLRQKHPHVGARRLCELHFHMIGATSLEQAIFDGYLAHVQAQHPGAPVPALFADEELFENAAKFCEKLGDAEFFAALNPAGAAAAALGLGPYGAGARWDRASFDAARQSSDPKERGRLFSALVKTDLFSAYKGLSARYIEIDRGLEVLAGHAKDLGYDGVILFLDEVVLWLASTASDYTRLHSEVQKMVKLVEAQHSARAVPLISFLARQRNLAELVTEQNVGAEQVALSESLKHWENRFDTITLEDRNLPTIIEKRILTPRGDDAKLEIERAFKDLRAKVGASWDTLLGSLDADAFRRVYPFSPALLSALVGLSQSLQRGRTALRIVLELLVEHIDDLQVGDLVRIGDLYDALAGGEDPADGIMRARFDSAKRLYRHELLPLIQERNQTTTPARCQRLREEHLLRLGCANCPERACRTENRLVKTLLIAALVPNVPELKNLTVSRLVALNHGSVKTVVPGGELQKAVGILRELASKLGSLRVGDQQDPTAGIVLEGIDLKPVLDQAREKDQLGARQKLVRDLLLEAMGLDAAADFQTRYEHTWHCTKRRGELRFANVRKLAADTFRLGDDDDFKLIVDYPFDEAGHSPNEDIEVLETYMEAGTGSFALVWLPSFFAKSVNDTVGELVVLNHILENQESRLRYLGHLSLDDRGRANADLESLRAQKKQQVLLALEQAYGLRNDKRELLDSGFTVERPLWLLKPGAQLQARPVADLSGALGAYLDGVLAARWPRHPAFEHRITAAEGEKLFSEFRALLETDSKSMGVERERLDKLRGTLGHLGLVRAVEGKVLLNEDGLLQRIEQLRSQAGTQRPTVDEVRRYVDETNKMGLDELAEDLVVRCYAAWAARTLVLDGKRYEGKPGHRIPGEVELDKPDLPSQTAWQKALALAGAVFGLTFAGKALHADNLKKLESELDAVLTKRGRVIVDLPNLLVRRSEALGLAQDADRLMTAASAAALIGLVDGQAGRALVESLAAFEPQTSGRAIQAWVAAGDASKAALDDELVFGTFGQLAARTGELEGAAELLDEVARVARQDELHAPLGARLRELAQKGQKILQGTGVKPPAGETVTNHRVHSAKGKIEALAKLDELVASLRTAIASAEDDVYLTGSIDMHVPLHAPPHALKKEP